MVAAQHGGGLAGAATVRESVFVIKILFGSAFTVASCYAAGRLVLRRARLQRGELELFAFVTGGACLSVLVFAAAALWLVYPVTFLLMGATLLALAPRFQGEPAPQLKRVWVFALVCLLYTALYFSQALGPEYSPDGSTYHLGYVARYLRQHGFWRITTSFYANLPQGLEMLFLFAFAFGKHSAAAMVHYAFLIALGLGMVTYARRFGFPFAGMFAAALVYLSPVFGYVGTVAYNDVAAACVVFFLFYLLQIWAEERQDALLIPIGLLAGFAYAIKYSAGIAIVYALAFVLWRRGSVLAVAASAALVAVPWMLKSWIVAGNPFTPFFNRWFPNPYVSAAFEDEYRGMYLPAEGPWAHFLDATFRVGPTAAIVGAVFLLAPLGILAIRSTQGRQLVLAALLFLAPGAFHIQTRFILPAVPFAALSMGLVIEGVPWLIYGLIALHAVLCWPTVMLHYADGSLRVRHFLPRQALRIEPEDSTLTYRLPGYRAAKMLERLTPPTAKIFCYADPAEAYTTRELLIYYESTANRQDLDLLTQGNFAELKRRGITHILVMDSFQGDLSILERLGTAEHTTLYAL
jgi:hypothetical protein